MLADEEPATKDGFAIGGVDHTDGLSFTFRPPDLADSALVPTQPEPVPSEAAPEPDSLSTRRIPDRTFGPVKTRSTPQNQPFLGAISSLSSLTTSIFFPEMVNRLGRRTTSFSSTIDTADRHLIEPIALHSD